MVRAITAEWGDWQGLDDEVQAPRYRALSRMLEGSESVLDVGCGEGVLYDWLRGRYLGVELSAAAVNAGRLRRPGAKIVQSGAETFDTDERFDAVVFSEMLYYARDPVSIAQRFQNFLAPGGRFVCSFYHKRPRVSWRARIARLIGPRSNAQCEQLVRDYLLSSGWIVGSYQLIQIPNTELHWSAWSASRS